MATGDSRTTPNNAYLLALVASLQAEITELRKEKVDLNVDSGKDHVEVILITHHPPQRTRGATSEEEELVNLFTSNFTTSAIYVHDSDFLKTIKQGRHESLKDYLTKFNKVALEIPNLHLEVHLRELKSGLRPGKF
ncbi:hypothetical protein PIB30_018521 [Stylosanthes scabra]|uniref:Retrotransposon gag domain-containing protein n=1 Tax=Stylosanthes scabra TaxID=79078 RepID=A0ABU6Y9T2_9FABA|nr:hypothetical protein [Stylosanthes scabra]